MADRKLRYSLRLEKTDFESLRTIHAEERSRREQDERDPIAESTVARTIFRRGLKAISEERSLFQWYRFFQPVRPGSGIEPDILLVFWDPPGFPVEEFTEPAPIAQAVSPLPLPEKVQPISRDLQLRIARPLRRFLLTRNGTEFLVEF